MPDLTPEEIPLARKIAYLKSLARGNGKWLPSYDHGQAAGDFWQAAGEVIAQRTPVEAALASFHYKVVIPLFADITRTLERSRTARSRFRISLRPGSSRGK